MLAREFGFYGVWVWLVSLSLLSAHSVAAPTEKQEPITLRTESFDSAVSAGTWWVKFFSPYCPHCVEFAPTWVEVYNDVRDEGIKNRFTMASVNCVTDGDLCDKEEVFAYPLLRLYVNGNRTDEYKSIDRRVSTLASYANAKMHGLEFVAPDDEKTPDAKAKEEVAKENAKATTSSSSAVTSTTTAIPVTSSTAASTTAVAATGIAESADSIAQGAAKPNPDGKSYELSEAEYNRILQSDEGWLVKFYSPRCPHCVKMGPAWEHVAKGLKDLMHVGAVNCDVERSACRAAGIDALPTIKFMNGPLEHEYSGLREHSEMVRFAQNAVEAVHVQEVDEDTLQSKIDENEKRASATFVYFYDDQTTQAEFDSMKQVAVSLIGNGRLHKSKSSALAQRMGATILPSLHSIADESRWKQFPAKSRAEMSDSRALIKWAKENWLALVPQLSVATAKSIFEHSDYLVLALANPKDDASHAATIRTMKTTALSYFDNKVTGTNADDQNGAKTAPTVGFAWIDAAANAKWLEGRYKTSIDTSVFTPRIVINQERGSKFWDHTLSEDLIDVSKTSILGVVSTIVRNPRQIRPKGLGHSFGGRLVNANEFVHAHLYLTLIGVAAFLFILVSRRRLRAGLRGSVGSAYHAVENKLD